MLKELGVDFEIVPAESDEVADCSLEKGDIARKIALSKAEEVFGRFPQCAVIGADTIVVLGDEILGKPKDADDQRRMLFELSGRKHRVYTGFALLTPEKKTSGFDVTDVYFNKLSDGLIDDYVRSGLGLDKAGGYGIQDGFGLVEKIDGSYSNVVGFPQEKFRKLLESFGLK